MHQATPKPTSARIAFIIAFSSLVLLLVLVAGASPVFAAVGSDFTQCRNGAPPTVGNCVWVGGNLNNVQATYNEGMGSFQRLMFTSIASGLTHKIDIQYQFSNQNAKKGYDFLISWAQAIQLHQEQLGVTPTMNVCAGMNPADTTICTNLVGSTWFLDVPLPDDPYVSDAGDGTVQSRINAFETAYLDRTIRIYSDCPFNGTPTFTISHLSADTTSSDVLLTMNYTTRAPVGAEIALSPNCLTGANAGVSGNVLLQFAGHLALSGTCALCWGPGKGAAAISGSGWHIRNIEFDDGGGSLDNQIQIKGFNPLAAEVVSFDASWKADVSAVRLKWSSANELTIMGYNVWRKVRKGDWKLQNEALIPAKNLGAIDGAAYQYLDSAVKLGKTYKYKIEIVHGGAAAGWSDVAKLRTPAPAPAPTR